MLEAPIKQQHFNILYIINKYQDLKYIAGNNIKDYLLDSNVVCRTIKSMLTGTLDNCSGFIQQLLENPALDLYEPQISSIDEAKNLLLDSISYLQEDFINISLPNILHTKPNKEAKISFLKKISEELTTNTCDLLYDRKICIEKLEKYLSSNEDVYLTPWDNINSNLSMRGIPKSHLITVAADTGVGKTLFTFQLLHHLSVSYNIKCAYFSLEMPMTELLLRQFMLFSSSITVSEVYNRNIPDSKMFEVHDVYDNIYSNTLYIYDQFNEYNKIVSAIIELVNLNFKVFAIDLLQLVKHSISSLSERERIDFITSDLKRLVNKYGILIFIVSHLHRREDLKLKNSVKSIAREPVLSDLKGASGIEQNSDKVFMLYDPNIKSNKETDNDDISNNRYVKILLRKDRVGQTFSTWLCHNTKLHRLIDADPNHDYDTLILK